MIARARGRTGESCPEVVLCDDNSQHVGLGVETARIAWFGPRFPTKVLASQHRRGLEFVLPIHFCAC
jgi:hypothetical protein